LQLVRGELVARPVVGVLGARFGAAQLHFDGRVARERDLGLSVMSPWICGRLISAATDAERLGREPPFERLCGYWDVGVGGVRSDMPANQEVECDCRRPRPIMHARPPSNNNRSIALLISFRFMASPSLDLRAGRTTNGASSALCSQAEAHSEQTIRVSGNARHDCNLPGRFDAGREARTHPLAIVRGPVIAAQTTRGESTRSSPSQWPDQAVILLDMARAAWVQRGFFLDAWILVQ